MSECNLPSLQNYRITQQSYKIITFFFFVYSKFVLTFATTLVLASAYFCSRLNDFVILVMTPAEFVNKAKE
jgi:hypothetical protein